MDTLAKLLRGRKRCSMTKMRREFTPEFKREAVALLDSSGQPLMQIATEFGVSPSMLRN
jgi:transposase